MKYLVICLSVLAIYAFYDSTRIIYIPGPARQDKAVRDLEKLKDALEQYEKKYERSSGTDNILMTLKEKGLISGVNLDPWGRDYIFSSTGSEIEISTFGREGKRGGVGEEYDISSTKIGSFKRNRNAAKLLRKIGLVVILMSPFFALYFYRRQIKRKSR